MPSEVIPDVTGPSRTVASESPGPSASSEQPNPPRQQPVWVRGYTVAAGRINVLLSDGRTLTEESGELLRVTRQFVETVDGQRFYLGVGLLATPVTGG